MPLTNFFVFKFINNFIFHYLGSLDIILYTLFFSLILHEYMENYFCRISGKKFFIFVAITAILTHLIILVPFHHSTANLMRG